MELKRKVEMNSFEINIKNSRQDIRGWCLYRLFNSTFYTYYLILDILLALWILFFTDFGRNDFESVIFIAVLIGILPVAGSLGIADKAWKRVKDRQRIIRFESEGVRSINEHIEVLYKWSGCKKVTETQKYIFAETIQGTPMFVLSKNWLSEDVLNNLWEWIALKEIKVKKK